MQKPNSFFLPPWTDPPGDLDLDTGQLHLWRFSLDLPPHELKSLKLTLSEDELARAHRLIDPVKADRFIAARGRMRQILSRYVSINPSALRFLYNPSGKPALDNSPEIGFNLSHSGLWALLAVVSQGEVGVDLEEIDPKLAFEAMARQFFSAAECAWLEQVASHRRRRVFYQLWTRKEAWLKGLGWGFSGSSNRIDSVGPGPGEGGWYVKNFPVAKGVIGALAVQGGGSGICCWQG